MARTRNQRSSSRRSDAGVESLSDSPTGLQVDGPIILQGATFVAPNIFIVGGSGGPGTVFVDGADTTSGFLTSKIANSGLIYNPGGNELFYVSPYVGVVGVNNANIVANTSANLIIFINNLTANRTVTLPAIATLTQIFSYTIKDISLALGFTITVTPTGADTIDRQATFPIQSGNNYSFNFVATQGAASWIVV